MDELLKRGKVNDVVKQAHLSLTTKRKGNQSKNNR